MNQDLTTPTEHDGAMLVICNGCRLAGRRVMGTFLEYFARQMNRASWRPDPISANKWLCPECNGLGSMSPRSMKAAAPELNVVIVSAVPMPDDLPSVRSPRPKTFTGADASRDDLVSFLVDMCEGDSIP